MVTIHKPGVITSQNFLSPSECQALIDRAENEIGFTEAAVRTTEGNKMIKDLRNNDRCMIDDFDLAAELWPRVKPLLSNFDIDAEPQCLNERFRFYKYGPEQEFKQHKDGIERVRGMVSHITFLLYLNSDFEGGHTNFIEYGHEDGELITKRLSVAPTGGSALLFLHRQFHEGAKVTKGHKYVLRSDVFYDR